MGSAFEGVTVDRRAGRSPRKPEVASLWPESVTSAWGVGGGYVGAQGVGLGFGIGCEAESVFDICLWGGGRYSYIYQSHTEAAISTSSSTRYVEQVRA